MANNSSQPNSIDVYPSLCEVNGIREVRGLGKCFKTVQELQARGYAFGLRYGSEALYKAFAWLRGE